ncbi:GNAT family N-acetyltransferase [Pelagovum pacificum]|uniref:GNAT family N-acetyltransferase n=1 Tax=Pelagovum pacificum TaxID=2588711 RepID=A0A5C5G9C8_9RHOB|nr:GNAT family N-acetyltransferase [Pelagovum pacificum]QQA42095.1 GNAT family N-acetyltransferase [Pelagovum pacificum]TNY31183.1 GNAT family N-acetyltransferase [Pelagovum pacificum]
MRHDPAILAAMFAGRDSRTLIANLDAQCLALTLAGEPWAATLSDGPTCYICSPSVAYVDYAIEEARWLLSPPLYRGIAAFARSCRPLVRASGLDRQVQLNNWLFSTNPVPPITPDAAAEVRDTLIARYPDRAIVLRSLNARSDAVTMTALREAGFRLLPSRQIYLYDARDALPAMTRDLRRDLKLSETTTLHWVENAGFTGRDYADCAALYDGLYLGKYTPLNPQYSVAFIEAMHRAGVLRLRGLRDDTGRIVAFAAMFEQAGVLTDPMIGYDLTRPAKDGLYRMLTSSGIAEARARGMLLNMSAGAAGFKRYRGAEAEVEYTAVYVRHLGRRHVAAVRAMELALTRIGVPLLRKYGL